MNLLSGQLRTLSEFAPLPEGDSQYPLEYIEAHEVLKLGEDQIGVTIGICDGVHESQIDKLQRFHRKQCTFVRIDRRELSAYLGRSLSRQSGEPQVDQTADRGDHNALDRLANDAPIVNLVNSLLIEAIRLDASDIHIESFADRILVRYRIDGTLRLAGTVPLEQFAAVSSRIKIMANLNIMERRLPQDGRISVRLEEKPFDMRVSIVPVAHGESIVLRLFQRTGDVMSLDELGLDEHHVNLMRSSVASPHGLFLMTGPTGSGKTTTLTAILKDIRSESRKIITIEDPIEYLIDGVAQIPTNDQIGLSFDSLLRRVLRHDPNIIMVGEIRDAATAELAVRAALTGHLVLSTLHTNDAVSAILRLSNMGIERYLIAGVLRAVMAQRLVRRVCPNCAHPVPLDEKQRRRLASFGINQTEMTEGAGCEQCGGSGYRGRVAIAELFTVDAVLEGMISSGVDNAQLAKELLTRGVRSLAADGYSKVSAGLTTMSEVDAITVG